MKILLVPDEPNCPPPARKIAAPPIPFLSLIQVEGPPEILSALALQVARIESDRAKLVELTGEIIATLHVNILRQTIVCATEKGREDLDRIMDAFRKRRDDILQP